MSYGSYLGATYANLFPTKVRAITLDGDADPVQWATGTNGSASRLGTFLRVGSDVASSVELKAFLDLCGRASTTACAFSAGSPAATHAKFDTLMDRLASHPVDDQGTTITASLVGMSMVIGLYQVQPVANLTIGWSGLAGQLQDIWTLTNGGAALAKARKALSAKGFTFPGLGTPADRTAPYPGAVAGTGVTCSDSPNPRDPASYPAQAALATARSGLPGFMWAWVTEACARWPVLAPQRYTGPWNHPTSAPILVVGNTFDPATPYWGAVAMSHDLADARLLTVNTYGHTALLNPSTCADAVEDAYFVIGALPTPGTVCQSDRAPFAG